MLFSIIFNFLIITTIFGYTLLAKKIFLKNNFLKVYNLDFIYGLFFLIFLAIIINFVLPLSKAKIYIIFFGSLIFIYGILKKKFDINLKALFLFLIIFSFFNYWNSNNMDSPTYHLQTINWIHNYKITFGLAILDWHYALNSVWHIFLSLMNLQYEKFNTIYIIGYLPFIFILTEIFSNKKIILLGKLILITCFGLLFLFSYIHPFRNGIILNHLGNPEVDTTAMVFFIICGYLFVKFYETKAINDFYLLFITSVICPLIKLSYIGSILFPLFSIFINRNNFRLYYNIITLFSSVLVLLWVIRNYILSSCFLFPFKNTCINSSWSLSVEQVSFYLKQTKSFARDAPLRENYLNFDYTLQSNNWIIPWIKNYYFKDAFLIIVSLVFFFSITAYLIIFLRNSYLNKKNKEQDLFNSILLIFFINFVIWFQSPEIRFGWGILIFFPCAILSLLVLKINLLNEKYIKFYSFIFILTIFLVVQKNIKYFKTYNLYTPIEKKFHYSKIIKFKEVNNFTIYRSQNWECADFKGICINKPKKNYYIEKKNNYIFISTTDKGTL